MSRIFPGLVVIARAKHPVPSRTRPLSAVAPMVLRLKTWESRSPPNLVKSETSNVSLNDDIQPHHTPDGETKTAQPKKGKAETGKTPKQSVAGWSSPVARQAHNLKVVGSNPTPATKITQSYQIIKRRSGAATRVAKLHGATLVTCHGIFPPFGIRVRPNEGKRQLGPHGLFSLTAGSSKGGVRRSGFSDGRRRWPRVWP